MIDRKTALRPKLGQARPGVPIFRTSDPGAVEQSCCGCGSQLLVGMSSDALYSVDLICAGCGRPTPMRDLPPGRGLGGVFRSVARDHRFTDTFLLDQHEVVAGLGAQRQRAAETGRDQADAAPRELGPDGVERLLADARAAFQPLLAPLGSAASRHPAQRRIDAMAKNLDDLRAGGREVDVRAAVRLLRPMQMLERWSQDPSSARLLGESLDPGTFDHNVALLEAASILDASELGPEFVAPTDRRTADLVLRVAAGLLIDIDVKTPMAVRWPDEGIKLVDPRKVVKKALRSSRGQFVRDGILVIAGEAWLNGVETYSEAARILLEKPIADDAGSDARAHYERLLGLIFVALGYREHEGGFGYAVDSRWVPNPRYAGTLSLSFPADFDGPFSLSFPSTPDLALGVPEPDGPAGGAARYRLTVDRVVELDGVVVNHDAPERAEPSAIWRFPQPHRPAEDLDFDVSCEVGFTTLTVRASGDVMCDPTVGWIDLRGVRFRADGGAAP